MLSEADSGSVKDEWGRRMLWRSEHGDEENVTYVRALWTVISRTGYLIGE